jgi:hypothetical protein
VQEPLLLPPLPLRRAASRAHLLQDRADRLQAG